MQNKHAWINVQSNDQYCFKWVIISAVYPINMSSNRCTSYKISSISDNIIKLENNIVLNFENFTFPLPTICENVFGLNDNNDIVGPYYSSINEKANHVNL